jgi:hypothetical protein
MRPACRVAELGSLGHYAYASREASLYSFVRCSIRGRGISVLRPSRSQAWVCPTDGVRREHGSHQIGAACICRGARFDERRYHSRCLCLARVGPDAALCIWRQLHYSHSGRVADMQLHWSCSLERTALDTHVFRMKPWPNQALQRTRHGVVVSNPCVPCAGSLSLGR